MLADEVIHAVLPYLPMLAADHPVIGVASASLAASASWQAAAHACTALHFRGRILFCAHRQLSSVLLSSAGGTLETSKT